VSFDPEIDSTWFFSPQPKERQGEILSRICVGLREKENTDSLAMGRQSVHA
jgi:hypothetical protein